ncbi:hypothetical protein CAPTEDRAFT_187353 [Capitella teleta]|uniref:Uncharacterized protein n=1 Tax=Capitella teleta TaxID=283909 RepID=X1ZK59_CAPTE|nr:hypothetical protein CAPTEDRAFT_187353 [Capitella teleta]|eukprot:ELU10180.1 hypothetical protein CAPTEDRAFT_187353 [Capitella teleta]
MGFVLQLRILLWKNFTLKRRKLSSDPVFLFTSALLMKERGETVSRKIDHLMGTEIIISTRVHATVSLWVLLFEMFIPLVLFVILLAIRHKQPPKPVGATNLANHDTKPVPSAGLLSILQTFCDGAELDQYHLPHFPNST